MCLYSIREILLFVLQRSKGTRELVKETTSKMHSDGQLWCYFAKVKDSATELCESGHFCKRTNDSRVIRLEPPPARERALECAVSRRPTEFRNSDQRLFRFFSNFSLLLLFSGIWIRRLKKGRLQKMCFSMTHINQSMVKNWPQTLVVCARRRKIMLFFSPL